MFPNYLYSNNDKDIAVEINRYYKTVSIVYVKIDDRTHQDTLKKVIHINI